ncbi:MAG: DapH/DapD/GlmU-related protein [Anaerovoracaceae bacterium]|uniref:N-acetyltransferase n=1 Tax=Candidatus Fimisoma avicola TaxID=2840826 RepID=A0A9D1L8S7_9FIRM|nr:N-acetyltransferase [Candidatus Fimisoma avicola]
MGEFFVHESSYVDDHVKIGKGTKIWHFCHIQSGAEIGENCSMGQNVNVSNNVKIGNGCKLQNNVSVYEGVEMEDYVFCGPSMVFTNDLTPRAKYPKGSAGYKKTLLKTGATVGANATIVCGHTIGKWAMIAAGAVVTKDVNDHALMAGVPAKQIGWVCECGNRLGEDLSCEKCGRKYILEEGNLKEGENGFHI